MTDHTTKVFECQAEDRPDVPGSRELVYVERRAMGSELHLEAELSDPCVSSSGPAPLPAGISPPTASWSPTSLSKPSLSLAHSDVISSWGTGGSHLELGPDSATSQCELGYYAQLLQTKWHIAQL